MSDQDELDTVVLPEELLHLLREVYRRYSQFGGVKIRRTIGGGWAAEYGNYTLLTPEKRGRDHWLLIEYPPPRAPISETVVEVGP